MKDVFKLSDLIPNFKMEEKDLFEDDPFFEGAEFMHMKNLIGHTVYAFKFKKSENRNGRPQISFMFKDVDDESIHFTTTGSKGIVQTLYQVIDSLHSKGKNINDYITRDRPMKFQIVKGKYFTMLKDI